MPTIRSSLAIPYRLLRCAATSFDYFSFDKETRNTQTPASFEDWLGMWIREGNSMPYWPVARSSKIVNWRNICIGVETSPGQMPGCYIQGIGKIYIGDYTQIAPNVGIISANHDLCDNRNHVLEEVRIGAYCWIGMGAVVLPNVVLGDFTVVGANSVVTKSFPEGHCVIAGSPAKLVKRLEISSCVRHRSEFEYHGFVPKAKFDSFKESNLNV